MDAEVKAGMFAVKYADGEFLKAGGAGQMPLIFWYKHKATQHARYLKGSRVVEVELVEKAQHD